MKSLALTVVPIAVACCALPALAADNLTYHGDTFRSGWNAQESVLTPAAVGSRSFRKLFSVPLDATTFAQPLVASGEQTGSGVHDLVIAVTMKDTVYAFDGHSGATVWKSSLTFHGAKAVPAGYTGCGIAPTYGIVSTPVIDRAADTLWAVGVVYAGSPTKTMHYYLHALSLATGADKQSPVEITGSVQEPGGRQTFIPDVQTQRPALTETNGNIYVAFGSICDYNANRYHGWVFAYNGTTLAQVGIYNVSPTQSSGSYYGGIWMDGDGPSVDPLDGSILFAVGNGTFDNNISFGDSVVRVSSNLATTLDYFTPYTVFTDNAYDADLGSGGLILLPDAPSSASHFAVVQGKDGVLTLMNREHLGGYTAGGPDNVLGELSLGGVWSTPAYFADSSGDEYLLTTGGPLYAVQVTRSPPGMSVVASTKQGFPQDNGNGSTPTVSSNGGAVNSAIVWIVQAASGSPERLTLFAYALTNLSQPLFAGSLGTWDLANAYLVPTVANGVVYVPGERHLYAYGLR